ncbi:hypothetical protein EK21DRAFT_115575 [Setomelanomma holmii]|uniref:Uncharacterized protein n=1 Tax=Setomelanomma holmii TaxID=210430 RepID=A0A9P4LHB9_9PLEO|nr:hypothetical protein EK21DRAFT_115575 [Setomelanomma holmii]
MTEQLVFVTYNITPEQWADFSLTADFPPEVKAVPHPNQQIDPNPPYVLVHSQSQADFARKGQIAKSVESEFAGASYSDRYTFLDRVSAPPNKRVTPDFMILLDEESA